MDDGNDGAPPSKRIKTAKEQKLEKKLKLRMKRSSKPRLASDMSLVTPDDVEKRSKVRSSSTVLKPTRFTFRVRVPGTINLTIDS